MNDVRNQRGRPQEPVQELARQASVAQWPRDVGRVHLKPEGRHRIAVSPESLSVSTRLSREHIHQHDSQKPTCKYPSRSIVACTRIVTLSIIWDCLAKSNRQNQRAMTEWDVGMPLKSVRGWLLYASGRLPYAASCFPIFRLQLPPVLSTNRPSSPNPTTGPFGAVFNNGPRSPYHSHHASSPPP